MTPPSSSDTTCVHGCPKSGNCCLLTWNWIALILAVFAACSPWWSWGYIVGQAPVGYSHSQPSYGDAAVSASPFVAGWVFSWTTANSGDTFCYNVRYPLYWYQISTQNACQNQTSEVFLSWGKPLGYCSTPIAGRSEFTVPHEPIAVQGLIISACVFLLIASIVGCAQVCQEDWHRKPMAAAVAALTGLSAILLCASFSLWADFAWVKLTNSNDSTSIAAWSTPSKNQLTAFPVNMSFGPSFAAAVTAFVLTVITTVMYAVYASDGFGQRVTARDQASHQPPSDTKSTNEPLMRV
jgi:hypothetical protein